MATTRKDTDEERKLYGEVAVVLFRMDKADPDVIEERPWKTAKPDYTRRARRVWKAFERHGLAIVLTEPKLEDDLDVATD